MQLFIDTSDNKKIIVSIKKGREIKIIKEVTSWSSQILLPTVLALLKQNGISWTQITDIRVHTGPGSFTGLRVGITVANVIGAYLNIAVNGKKAGNVYPIYEQI